MIAVCPKGMGPSVRRLYEQGREIDGAGINASFAIEQDINGRATDYALAWAVAIGSPCTFQTTLESEFKSDIFGERGILLGAVHGIVESLYHWFSADRDFRRSRPSSIRRNRSPARSHRRFPNGDARGVRIARHRPESRHSSAPTAPPTSRRLKSCWRSTTRSRPATRFAASSPPTSVCKTLPDGQDRRHRDVAGRSRGAREPQALPDPARTCHRRHLRRHDDGAGRSAEGKRASIFRDRQRINYRGGRFAQSLHALQGVAFMVDNCSTTARLGTRKWAPRFEYGFRQTTFPALQRATPPDDALFESFLGNDIHQALAVCAELRPPVNIAVVD